MRAIWTTSLLVSLCVAYAEPVGAAGVSVKDASKEQWSAAEKTFRVADDLFDKKRFGEALTAYRASYEIVASPNSRLMVARSLRELGRLGEAYRELEGTLAEARSLATTGKKYQNTLHAAEEELAALKQHVAFVVIELVAPPEGTTLVVGGKPVALDAIAEPLVVAPGAVSITASAPGKPKLVRELELAAGSSAEVRLDFDEARNEEPQAKAATPVTSPTPRSEAKLESPAGGSTRTLAYVAGGVGVLGFAAFGVFGAMNNSKFDSLDSECTDGRCPPGRQSDIDAGRRYQTIANIGLVVGIVGVGTGVTLLLVDKPSTRKAGGSRWISVGVGQVHAGGRF